ncbi:hypothetical protein diail_1924 [Diaporthe ilicicola]|nr:hypothetical protein diail_1924 [Diaporthe ilicicola]
MASKRGSINWAPRQRYNFRSTTSRVARGPVARPVVIQVPEQVSDDGFDSDDSQPSSPVPAPPVPAPSVQASPVPDSTVPAVAFHYFEKLPVELQDMIWEQAFSYALTQFPWIMCFKIALRKSRDGGSIICFSPESLTVASIADHRTFLGICRATRAKLLKHVSVLDLFQVNPSDGKAIKYRIPFFREKTYFCIEGGPDFDIPVRTRLNTGRTRGLEFAKDIKGLAIVLAYHYGRRERSQYVEPLVQLSSFIHPFHNVISIGTISPHAYRSRRHLGMRAFPLAFSFQPLVQKSMVQGQLVKLPIFERRHQIEEALKSCMDASWINQTRAWRSIGVIPLLIGPGF